MEINENFRLAQKDMIRADHLLYVSLKYSRTIDVIRSLINRLIDAFDLANIAVLEEHLQGDELKKTLHGSKTRTDALVKIFPETQEYVDFYFYLRKLYKGPVLQSLSEFRKNVTLVTEIDGKEERVDLVKSEEFYFKMKDFIKLLNKLMHEVDEEEVYRH